MDKSKVKRELDLLREAAQGSEETDTIELTYNQLRMKYEPLINQLPDSYRIVMYQKFILGNSNDEVAKMLSYSKETIKKRTKKGIELISRQLQG